MKKEEILAKCIEEIRSGKSTVEDCANKYSHLGAEFRSRLHVAMLLKPDEVVLPEEFKQQLNAQIFSGKFSAPKKLSDNFWNWRVMTPAKLALVSSVVGAFVVFACGGSVVYAAQNSLPGNTLYSVKTEIENLRLAMTTSSANKAILHVEFAQERVNEITQEVQLNQNVSPQMVDAVTQQFDSALNALSNTTDSTDSEKALSKLSTETLNQQVELNQLLPSALSNSQSAIQQLIGDASRGNTIAQVAYANHDLLQNHLSITDNQLDAGQFSIQGDLISIDGNTWNVGGTIINNVHLTGKIPATGSNVSLQGLVKDDNTYISNIEVDPNSTGTTAVEGQFSGANQNGTVNISGLAVNVASPVNTPLSPGDVVQLQGSTDNSKLNVTNVQSSGNQSTTLEGNLISVNSNNGTIKIKVTGNYITVNIAKAHITSKNENHNALQISDLNRSVGHDISLLGLSKINNVFTATQVQVENGK